MNANEAILFNGFILIFLLCVTCIALKAVKDFDNKNKRKHDNKKHT